MTHLEGADLAAAWLEKGGFLAAHFRVPTLVGQI